jgi:protein TonB
VSHDLFGDVMVGPSTGRARRRSLIVLSVVAHGVLLAAVVAISIVAPDALPVPARAIAFFESEPVMPIDVPLPSPPAAPRRVPPTTPSEPDAAVPNDNAAPVKEPVGISDEPDGFNPIDRDGLRGIENPGPEVGTGTMVGRSELPSPPPPREPVRLHSGIQAPKKVVDVLPLYPPAARLAQIQGIVILEVVIGAGGRVESARVLRSVPLLDQAAIDAVRQWTYTPALLNGTPIPVMMTLTVNFRLSP